MTLSRLLMSVIAIGLLNASVLAASVTLQVIDQHGQVLPNAVIEVSAMTKPVSALPIAVMDQVNKQFTPEVLIVQQGQKVNFPNSDDIRHHVYSFSEAKPFQLKLYSGQPEAPIEFDNTGLVVLGCNIHDTMVGYIYVTDSAVFAKSDSQGKATLNNINFPVEVSVWHPLQAMPLEQKQLLRVTKAVTVVINTQPPAPRNTFENKFKATNDQ